MAHCLHPLPLLGEARHGMAAGSRVRSAEPAAWLRYVLLNSKLALVKSHMIVPLRIWDYVLLPGGGLPAGEERELLRLWLKVSRLTSFSSQQVATCVLTRLHTYYATAAPHSRRGATLTSCKQEQCKYADIFGRSRALFKAVVTWRRWMRHIVNFTTETYESLLAVSVLCTTSIKIRRNDTCS